MRPESTDLSATSQWQRARRAVVWGLGAVLIAWGALTAPSAPMRAAVFLILGVVILPRTRRELVECCRIIAR